MLSYTDLFWRITTGHTVNIKFIPHLHFPRGTVTKRKTLEPEKLEPLFKAQYLFYFSLEFISSWSVKIPEFKKILGIRDKVLGFHSLNIVYMIYIKYQQYFCTVRLQIDVSVHRKPYIIKARFNNEAI